MNAHAVVAVWWLLGLPGFSLVGWLIVDLAYTWANRPRMDPAAGTPIQIVRRGGYPSGPRPPGNPPIPPMFCSPEATRAMQRPDRSWIEFEGVGRKSKYVRLLNDKYEPWRLKK